MANASDGTGKPDLLKKELSLFGIYAIATGATISGGFFLLPGLAATKVGPALTFSYLLAIVPLLPGILAKLELSTAMPRAGGVYYFLDRSAGPMVGTIGGLGVWLVVILKTSFALIGMGAYLKLFIPGVPMTALACGLALLFGLLNLGGSKLSGGVQAIFVLAVITILSGFIGFGMVEINTANFRGMTDVPFDSIAYTAGILCVSYIGMTKVSSVAEEVKNPERNLPLGVFLALGTAMIIYVLGAIIMTGVVPPEHLNGTLTAPAEAARILGGRWAVAAMTAAAIFAFLSVANAGILSASRYPLAMSRDNLVPGFFRRLSRKGIPRNSILVTVGVVLFVLVAFDPLKIAKLAGAFQLIMFALSCLAVIVMRESRIHSYDPGYRSPWYPWLHIAGIIGPLWFITHMGVMPLYFSIGMVLAGGLWFHYYARKRVTRGGAILHMFARLGEKRYEGLDQELRGILREKGLRAEDPFDELIAKSHVVDLPEDVNTFEGTAHEASRYMSDMLGLDKDDVEARFIAGAKTGATPVSRGAALPHIRVDFLDRPELVMVRARHGLKIDSIKEFWGELAPDEPVYALFFLAGPEKDPRMHLRILAQIAGHVEDEDFINDWRAAEGEQDLKEILLRDERFLSLPLEIETPTADLIGRALNTIRLPEDTLIAMIHRNGKIIVPRGHTVLEEGDRLTIVGETRRIKELRKIYGAGLEHNKRVREEAPSPR